MLVYHYTLNYDEQQIPDEKNDVLAAYSLSWSMQAQTGVCSCCFKSVMEIKLVLNG